MRLLGALGALFAAAALAPASLSAPAGRAQLFVGGGVQERLATEARVRVLVSRDAPPAGGSEAPPGFEVVHSLSGGRILTGWLTRQGLSKLASDGATSAVVLDRIVRSTGQVGTAQIGADRLFAAGLTGEGRTIGIIDTGIDFFHPDLGATASGGGRVVGGWNFADGTADFYDCDGHGTEVAGVAAGVQGVAPGASIVALKVFGARDGCSAALASDILSAVDWALERREELRIDVLNVSLADDRVRSGFCDEEDPVSAQLFAHARAEGVAVVAASGNAGRSDGLAWPACHSGVVSVGMVYSASQGPTAWGSDADCADMFTGPDLVPCASNGGPALSLLAPGVRWLVPASGGGRRTTFSGTSAAAPAAAGSLLLARQVAPLGDPLLFADFLRLTGVPVTDARTGASTPRVDLGAAFYATSPFTGPCERVPGFGTVPEATVCTADVSALLGDVTSLALALSIEHTRLSGLRAFLTGPDGTTVRLVSGPGRAGTVFREVIGRTFESDEPISVFAGHPAAGTWTLRLEDDSGLAGERLTSWALVIEPEAPRPADPPGPFSQLLPTVARNAGLHGSFFSTDVVLFNPDLAPASVTLSFLPSAGSTGAAVSVEVPLRPLETRVLSDVVGNAFRTTGAGPVHVQAPGGVVAASRTATTAAGGGSYGLLACGVDPGSGVGAEEASTWITPAFQAGRSRINVGIVETAGFPASVEIVVRDGEGFVKGRVAIEVAPFGSRQLNDVHQTAAVPASAGDLFEVRVVSGPGRVVAWATAVDNRSNDGLLVLAARPRRETFLPAAAHSPGRFGSFFRTDLKLSNPSPAPVNVRIDYSPSKGTTARRLVLTLGAWETRVFEDVVADLLTVEGDGAGALHLSVLGTAGGIVASSRTWTEGPSGSYGLAIDVLDGAQAVPGDRIALTFLSSTPETRTNLGFVETVGVATKMKVTLLDAGGGRLATRELFLDRAQAVQWNDVFAEMGVPPQANASALVEVLEGGAVLAHAIRVDNRTNDASFLPGRVLKASPASPQTAR